MIAPCETSAASASGLRWPAGRHRHARPEARRMASLEATSFDAFCRRVLLRGCIPPGTHPGLAPCRTHRSDPCPRPSPDSLGSRAGSGSRRTLPIGAGAELRPREPAPGCHARHPGPSGARPDREDARTFGVVLDTSGSMERQRCEVPGGHRQLHHVPRRAGCARGVLRCRALRPGIHDAGRTGRRVSVRGVADRAAAGIDLLETADDFPHDAPSWS